MKYKCKKILCVGGQPFFTPSRGVCCEFVCYGYLAAQMGHLKQQWLFGRVTLKCIQYCRFRPDPRVKINSGCQLGSKVWRLHFVVFIFNFISSQNVVFIHFCMSSQKRKPVTGRKPVIFRLQRHTTAARIITLRLGVDCQFGSCLGSGTSSRVTKPFLQPA